MKRATTKVQLMRRDLTQPCAMVMRGDQNPDHQLRSFVEDPSGATLSRPESSKFNSKGSLRLYDIAHHDGFPLAKMAEQ